MQGRFVLNLFNILICLMNLDNFKIFMVFMCFLTIIRTCCCFGQYLFCFNLSKAARSVRMCMAFSFLFLSLSSRLMARSEVAIRVLVTVIYFTIQLILNLSIFRMNILKLNIAQVVS